MNPGHSLTANPRVRRRNRMILLSTLAGACVGISADLFGYEHLTMGDTVGAVLIWPCVVTCAGGFVALESARYPLFVGGLAFFPGYVLLLLVCRRWPSYWTYMVLFLWCVQGFFQLGCRWCVLGRL